MSSTELGMTSTLLAKTDREQELQEEGLLTKSELSIYRATQKSRWIHTTPVRQVGYTQHNIQVDHTQHNIQQQYRLLVTQVITIMIKQEWYTSCISCRIDFDCHQ